MKKSIFTYYWFGITAMLMPFVVKAEDKNEGAAIKIRVHVPYTERLKNERFHRMIVRIENHGAESVILLTEKDEGIAQFAQFRSQTRKDAENGVPLSLPLWSNLKKIADFSIPSGQAIEMLGGSAMGVDLSRNGESRLVFQIGPDEVVYSNWVKLQTIPAQSVSDWPVIATVQITPGETGVTEFLVGTTPSGKWLFRRPVWNRNLLSRVCLLPDGEIPKIVGDTNKWQAAVIFNDHPEATIYFSGALGISRSTKWPDRHRGSDFVNRTIPVGAPSPLEFPLQLFADNEVSPGEPGVTNESKSHLRSHAPSNQAQPDDNINSLPVVTSPGHASDTLLNWILIVSSVILVAALGLIYRFSKNGRRIGNKNH